MQIIINARQLQSIFTFTPKNIIHPSLPVSAAAAAAAAPSPIFLRFFLMFIHSFWQLEQLASCRHGSRDVNIVKGRRDRAQGKSLRGCKYEKRLHQQLQIIAFCLRIGQFPMFCVVRDMFYLLSLAKSSTIRIARLMVSFVQLSDIIYSARPWRRHPLSRRPCSARSYLLLKLHEWMNEWAARLLAPARARRLLARYATGRFFYILSWPGLQHWHPPSV